MMSINISIVTYKTNHNAIQKVIESCINRFVATKIFIINNSPTDNLKEIKKLNPIIEYIFNPLNAGYGAAHNIAMQKSIEEGVKYHLVLNPDIYFDSDVLKSLINYMDSNEDVGLVMPKILYPNGEVQYLCKLFPAPIVVFGRRFLPFKNFIKEINEIYELRFSEYNKIMEVPYLSGCFMLIRVDLLKNIGLFDENFFMYFEDTDLCRRLGKVSKTIYFPKVHIYHEYEKGSYKNLKLLKYHIKSAVYYFNKWGWFFDNERKIINKEQLRKLNYKISKFKSLFLM